MDAAPVLQAADGLIPRCPKDNRRLHRQEPTASSRPRARTEPRLVCSQCRHPYRPDDPTIVWGADNPHRSRRFAIKRDVNLDEELDGKIVQYAAEQGTSISAAVRALLADGLAAADRRRKRQRTGAG